MKKNNFSTELDSGFKKAFNIRKKNFSSDIFFFAPNLKKYESDYFPNSSKSVFVPISLTGSSCALNCKHCGGILLESMYPISSKEDLYKKVQNLTKRGTKGILITAGSRPDGSIPLKSFLPTLRKIKDKLGLKLAAHTGLLDKETAIQMKGIFDVAMLDIIGDENTINEVYNLNKTPVDFYNSIEYLLQQDIAIAPHILAGLHFGEIKGEYRVIEKLSSYNLSSLVFVIIKKIKGTVFDELNIKPPPPKTIGELFIAARENFPHTPLLLGCARPGGKYENQIDVMAIKTGFNGIAYPSDTGIAFSKELALNQRFSNFCCSFLFMML